LHDSQPGLFDTPENPDAHLYHGFFLAASIFAFHTGSAHSALLAAAFTATLLAIS